MSLKITIMTISDYDDIFDLWKSDNGVGLRSLDDSKEGIDKFLRRNPTTCFTAKKDGKIVGCILCGNDGRRGYIYHTIVKPKYRGQGVGKELVQTAIKALQSLGINKAALVVFDTNESGNEFWESLGFAKRDDLMYRDLSLNKENN